MLLKHANNTISMERSSSMSYLGAAVSSHVPPRTNTTSKEGFSACFGAWRGIQWKHENMQIETPCISQIFLL